MEIDITDFFNGDDPSNYSASRVELGVNAGKITWEAAKERAASPPQILDTEDKLDALRDHVKGFGAWEPEEIAAWDAVECNALFIQMVSGDMREADLGPAMSIDDWAEYERRSERGEVAGSIFRGEGGAVYYYLGD